MSVSNLPSGLLTPHATPLFFSMSDSEEARTHSRRNDGVLDLRLKISKISQQKQTILIIVCVSESVAPIISNIAIIFKNLNLSRGI